MNRSTGQRLAGPYSAPGFRPKTGCAILSRPNFFLRGFISSGVITQLRRQRFRICAQRGDQMQNTRESGGPDWISDCAIGDLRVDFRLSANRVAGFHQRSVSAFSLPPARGGDGVGQEKIPPRTRVTDALRNAGQPDFKRRTRRIGQHQRKVKISRAQFRPTENTLSSGAKEMVSFTAG